MRPSAGASLPEPGTVNSVSPVSRPIWRARRIGRTVIRKKSIGIREVGPRVLIVTTMTPIGEWTESLQRVGSDLYELDRSHAVYRKLIDQIKVAPWVDHSGGLFETINWWHRDHLLLAIRRHTDCDDRSKSLASLIQEVATRRQRFTRADFVVHYKESGFRDWESLANHRFDELCACEGLEEYPACRADRHVEWLSKTSKTVRVFVNKIIAHHGDQRQVEPIRRQRTRRLLWVLRGLQAHYEVLATGSSPPPDPIDWVSIELPETESPWVITHWHQGLSTHLDSCFFRRF